MYTWQLWLFIFYKHDQEQKNSRKKLYNLNLRTYLLYIRSFYVYMIVMIWWYWFWKNVCTFVDRTIFSIAHIFMYMIIYKCMCFFWKFLFGINWCGEKLIFGKLTFGKLKKIDPRFFFMPRFELISLLGFFFQSPFT